VRLEPEKWRTNPAPWRADEVASFALSRATNKGVVAEVYYCLLLLVGLPPRQTAANIDGRAVFRPTLNP